MISQCELFSSHRAVIYCRMTLCTPRTKPYIKNIKSWKYSSVHIELPFFLFISFVIIFYLFLMQQTLFWRKCQHYLIWLIEHFFLFIIGLWQIHAMAEELHSKSYQMCFNHLSHRNAYSGNWKCFVSSSTRM